MKLSPLVPFLALLSGCAVAVAQTHDAPPGAKGPRYTVLRNEGYAFIRTEWAVDYVIVPPMQTCILKVRYEGVSAPVDCAKVKENFPEAARIITW